MPSWFNGRRQPKPPVTPTIDVPEQPPDHIRGAGTKQQQLWARLLVNSRRDLHLPVPAWLQRLSRGEDVRGTDEPTGNPGSGQAATVEPSVKDAYDALRATLDEGEGRSRLGYPGPEQARADLVVVLDRARGGGFLEARAQLARSRTPDLDDVVDVPEHPGPPPVPRGMSGESRPPTRAPNTPATQQGQ